MGEALGERYWCHSCEREVDPVLSPEIKCPMCDDGFVEEMSGRDFEPAANTRSDRSDRSLSLWGPILLAMLDRSPRRSRTERSSSAIAVDDDGDEEDDSDREFEEFMRRRSRRRRSTAVLRLLQSIHEDVRSESDSAGRRPRERAARPRERGLLLINSNNDATLIHALFGSDDEQGESNGSSGSATGDSVMDRGLDFLLQYLAETDPNHYGTPPAKKESVEALETVAVDEALTCPVCLDDFLIGTDAKAMPCKHKFHSGCILPWLELHSSCPVCRFQLPSEEAKDSTGSSSRAAAIDDDRTFPSSPFSTFFSSRSYRGGASSDPDLPSPSGTNSNTPED